MACSKFFIIQYPPLPTEVPTSPFLTSNTFFSQSKKLHFTSFKKNYKMVPVFCKVDKIIKSFELYNNKNIFTHHSDWILELF
jgi:hypothetical protein